MDNHSESRTQNERLCLQRGMKLAKLILASNACNLDICESKMGGKQEEHVSCAVQKRAEFLCFYKYIPGWLLEKDTWAHSTCHSCALWLAVYAVGGNPLIHSLVPGHIVMVEFPSSDTPQNPRYLFWKWLYAFLHQLNIPLTITLKFED